MWHIIENNAHILSHSLCCPQASHPSYHKWLPLAFSSFLFWQYLCEAVSSSSDAVIRQTKGRLVKGGKWNMDLEWSPFSSSTEVSTVFHWRDHLSTHWPKMLSDPNEGSFFSRPCCPLGSTLHCPGERPALAWISKDRWGTKVRWLTFPPHWILTH